MTASKERTAYLRLHRRLAKLRPIRKSVKLKGTEHENTIECVRVGGRWFWWFNELTIDQHCKTHDSLLGPFKTMAGAVEDAVCFCEESIPLG